MNLTSECGWALLRALGVGVLALAAGYPLCGLIAGLPRGRRRWAWAALLVPYLTPVVLVGYAYSNFALSLVHHPLLNELFYGVLLVLKLCPAAVVVLYFAPSGLSREAMHCRRLVLAGRHEAEPIGQRLAFFVHGRARKACVAFAVVFLFAFSEFEMASLLNTTAWTVSLFDAQAGGLALSRSLRLAWLPIVCEALLLVTVMAMLFGSRRAAGSDPERVKPPGRAARCFAWLYLAAAVVVAAVVPMAVVLRGTLDGFAVLAKNPGLARDIATSVLFAGSAAAIAYLGAGWFSSRASHGSARLLGASALSIPGLLGALLLGLIVLSVFQLAALRAAYDTPLPLVVTLTLLLFPFAVLLRVLLEAFGPAEGVHAAALLVRSPEPVVRRSGRTLVWDLRTRGRFLVAVLLFCWGYFEVGASALLAPSAMTPAFVRLYNFMHYGQITGLSAMVLAAFLVPVLLLIVAESARGILVGLKSHG